MTSTHLSLHYPLVFSTRARRGCLFEKGSCSESMHRLSVRFVMVTPAPTMKRFRVSSTVSLLARGTPAKVLPQRHRRAARGFRNRDKQRIAG